MDKINNAVSENIRRLRKEKGLSLDELARLSGVSKSMLAQIERRSGNPTLSTLWKIAGGLDVQFNDLVVMEEQDPYRVIKLSETDPILTADGRVRNYPIFPDDEQRGFSIYHLEIEPGAEWSSEPHMTGTAEIVTVLCGEIMIEVDGRYFRLSENDSFRFKADIPHSYRNTGARSAVIHNILYRSYR